jgi:hypothetical protein
MTTLLSLLKLFWTFGKHLPAIVSVITQIVSIIGSEKVQKVLESIRDIVKQESPEKIPDIPQTEHQRERIVERVWRRISLAKLGISEADYDSYCAIRGNMNAENIA